MHKVIAHEIIEILHERFPDAGIAVSGSVAAGTYQPNSDIDLLFVRKTYTFPFCIHFTYNGIDVSLFSFHLDTLKQEKDKMTGHYFAMPISYIFHAQIAYDPQYVIEDMKEEIDYILRKRRILRKELVEARRQQIYKLLQRQSTSSLEQKMDFNQLVDAIVSIFFLSRHADKLVSKKETGEIFSIMEQEDKELWDILHSCLPYHKNSYKKLAESMDKILSQLDTKI